MANGTEMYIAIFPDFDTICLASVYCLLVKMTAQLIIAVLQPVPDGSISDQLTAYGCSFSKKGAIVRKQDPRENRSVDSKQVGTRVRIL